MATALSCEGPVGPEGPQGLQGEKGEPGEQGPPGTANVIFSEWIRIGDVTSRIDTTILSRNYARYHIPASELTQEMIDGGAIQVFYKLGGLITPLPFTLASLDVAGLEITITFATLQPGRITILSQRENNTSFGLNLNTEFRYVLIPGGMPAKLPPGIFDNYSEMTRFFGIQD